MIIKAFDDLNLYELYEILTLRSEIFVIEQNCIYQDIDDVDKNSYHIFIKENNKIVAYARLIKKGYVFNNSVSIGRVLVKANYRKKGYARRLMNFTIQEANKKFPKTDIVISAQEYLVKFYNSLGFKQVSNMYLEDDIPHVKMILTNQKAN